MTSTAHRTPDVIWLPVTVMIPPSSCELFANRVRFTSDVTVTTEVFALDSSISSMCQWLTMARLKGNVGIKSPVCAVASLCYFGSFSLLFVLLGVHSLQKAAILWAVTAANMQTWSSLNLNCSYLASVKIQIKVSVQTCIIKANCRWANTNLPQCQLHLAQPCSSNKLLEGWFKNSHHHHI